MISHRDGGRGKTLAVSRKPSVILLGMLTAIDAMAIDSYIPALPAIQQELSATKAAVQSSLAIFLFGVGLGQTFWGPVSDRYGRRGPLVVGLVCYVIGSVSCVFSPDLPLLIAGRLLQALGASAGLVLARAIVNDLWPEDDAARIYTVLMQTLGVTALVSPLIGSSLLVFGSWRLIFAMLALVGIACLGWTAGGIPESLQLARRPTPDQKTVLRGYLVLVRNPAFMWATCAAAFSTAAMFAILAGSPFIFIDGFGWSVVDFSIFYAATSAGFLLFCQINVWALKRSDAGRLLGLGLMVQMVVAPLLLLLFIVPVDSGLAAACLLAILVAVLGLILGNAVAVAMRLAPPLYVGTASGMIGLLQFSVSGLVTPLSTLGGGVGTSTACVAGGCAVVSWLAHRMTIASATRARV